MDDMELLTRIYCRAVAKFSGDVHELESAVGVLFVGYLFGYRFIRLVHNKRTLKRYEGILGISFKNLFDDLGPAAYRSAGLANASEFSNFWRVVSGDVKIKDRRLILTHEEVVS